MDQTNTDIQRARQVLSIESVAISRIGEQLDERFVRALDLIESCEGRVVVSGVGKSGLVGRKIAATLASTGTPALFLHPAEGAHGDLGMLVNKDILLLISNSGETREISELLPWVKRIGAKIISMVGRPNSTMAEYSDVVLDVTVEKEACPHNLAPTASTAAQLALGDALAIALLQRRNFRPEDFACLHPGGSLAKQLMKVEELMHSGDENPVVSVDTPMREAIAEISSKTLGAVNVIKDDGTLAGIITDGDLRRALVKMPNLLDLRAKDVMTPDPITISERQLAAEAISIMENRPTQIAVLPVVNEKRVPVGMIRLHDLVKAGV